MMFEIKETEMFSLNFSPPRKVGSRNDKVTSWINEIAIENHAILVGLHGPNNRLKSHDPNLLISN